MNFHEIANWQLTSEECAVLKKLNESADFKFFRGYIEQKLLKTSFALSTGTPAPGVDLITTLHELRGIGKFWREITLKLDNLN
jgi:hypothetical protein